ncbi:putative alpha-L-arabinofuranosidase B [Diplonema papillatum]|nr:putative alpha-L-arabinofuranosidase B [Diplonema papillatum]KAJ9457855.1 putative alpha-L-arabinofuranosidase B [Diplonema papillatum]
MKSMLPLLLAAAGAAAGPCDLYVAGGTPCVAAHSMVRALYDKYNGSLYQVQRASDNLTLDIPLLAAGGFANSAVQDAFCMGTDCEVLGIYDQSPSRNHLSRGPGGGAAPGADKGVNASKHRITVGGHPVYGAYFEGGMGYRNDTTTGVATGDEPETLYAVFDGTVFNDKCCFDYGNAETDNHDDGKTTMEAIYWGSCGGWGRGGGDGPWIMADLENGLWAGNTSVYAPNPSVLDQAYVTAMVKGGSNNTFGLRGGNAQTGPLSVLFQGTRPPAYTPMQKQGAIILGIGGDNSNSAIGVFFEGAITAGLASDSVDAAVHANIQAAGYGK